MQLNEVKKDPGRHYLLEVRAPQGTRLGLLSVDQSVYLLRNENRLTKDRVSGVALQCYNSSVFLFHWFCFSLRWLIQPSYEEREDYFALRGYPCMRPCIKSNELFYHQILQLTFATNTVHTFVGSSRAPAVHSEFFPSC